METKQTHLDTMFQSLAEAMKPVTDMFILGAIWIENKIMVKDGWFGEYELTRRITPGSIVGVKDGNLTDYNPNDIYSNSYEVKECRGTLNNTRFEMDLENIETKEPLTITL